MIIKNIRLINPVTEYDAVSDIVIRDGIVESIKNVNEKANISCASNAQTVPGDTTASNQASEDDDTIIDGTGLVCAPGLMDVHVHFRDPGFTHKEDIYTGAKAAAAGGFTTVVLMANVNPHVDNEETLKYILDKGRETDINVLTVANVTMGSAGRELTDFKLLSSKGAAGFSDDGIPIMDEELLREAFIRAKECNLPVSLHEENPAFITNNGINAGKVSEALGIKGSPREAEIFMIERDINIAISTGADIDVQHISTKEGVELVRNARKEHKNIHAEATPHHFTLTEDAVLKYGSNAKMNPPLRTEEDRLAVIEGLKDGTIEIIATDHAPHTSQEKSQEITKAPSGILGLETALSLGITNLVEPGYLSLSELIDRMTAGPARLYGMSGTTGSVEVGRKADLVIFDKNESYEAGTPKSKSSNSPFIGMTLKGKVKYTICSGRIVYEDGKN